MKWPAKLGELDGTPYIQHWYHQSELLCLFYSHPRELRWIPSYLLGDSHVHYPSSGEQLNWWAQQALPCSLVGLLMQHFVLVV
jgi:hypothetical protein